MPPEEEKEGEGTIENLSPDEVESRVANAVAAKEAELLKSMNDNRAASDEAWRVEREKERREFIDLMRPAKEPEKEEQNPHDQSMEPAAWAEWQATTSARKAVEELTAKTLQPAADQLRQEIADVRELGSTYTREKLSSDPYYSRYEKEIKEHLSKLPQNQRNDPRAMKEVLTYVKGQHIDDILTEEREKAANHSETGGGIGRPKQEDGVPITPKVEKLAKRYGMEPKEYAEALIAQGVDPAHLP